MNHSRPVLFDERQGMPKWARILALAIPAGAAYMCYVQLLLKRPVGNRPMSDAGLIVLTLALLAFSVLLSRIHLRTRVYPGLLTIRLWPFVNRRVPVEEIEKIEVRTYSAIREYGGWGWRFGFAGDTAYTMWGNRGVQVRLRGGKGFLIGSQKPGELAAALRDAGAGGDVADTRARA